MKSLLTFIIASLLLVSVQLCSAQGNSNKASIAVLDIDVKGFTIDPVQMGDITRVELSKIGKFELMDKYDVEYLVEKNDLSIAGCYGKLCLVEIGKILKVDKIIGGSVELYQDMVVVTIRQIDVGTSEIEKTQVMEFLNIRNQVQTMVGMTLQTMYDIAVDENVMTKLTKKFDYESSVNTPQSDRLALNGPRMGLTMFSGTAAEILKSKEVEGGLDMRPQMFHFGYQFEVKYLNQGDFQALFEFIPIISGLDQGKFIPSFSLLNGLRHNRFGWEFAFGPNIALTKVADGYYDESGDWHLENEWFRDNPDTSNPFPIEERMDSRGDHKLVSGFLFGIGKTFRSGRLNIPVNVFFIPGKDDSHRFGISMGYNVSNYK